MKIHMDYLEQKIEDFERARTKTEFERSSFLKRIKSLEDSAAKTQKEIEQKVQKAKEEAKREIENAI